MSAAPTDGMSSLAFGDTTDGVLKRFEMHYTQLDALSRQSAQIRTALEEAGREIQALQRELALRDKTIADLRERNAQLANCTSESTTESSRLTSNIFPYLGIRLDHSGTVVDVRAPAADAGVREGDSMLSISIQKDYQITKLNDFMECVAELPPGCVAMLTVFRPSQSREARFAVVPQILLCSNPNPP